MVKQVASTKYRFAAKAAAFFNSQSQKLANSNNKADLRKIFSVVAVAALCLNFASTSVPFLMAEYAAAQARIPKPLPETSLSQAPAATAASRGKSIEKMPSSIEAKLAAEYKAQTQGKPQNHSRIKILSQTANSTTYLNADGTKTLVQGVQAQNFQNQAGQWQSVNNALVEDPQTGIWHSTANSWQASFGSLGATGIQIRNNGQTFGFTPAGGNNVKPQVTGKAPNQTVTYQNVWQGVDLRYNVLGSELVETIVIRSKVATSNYSFITSGSSLVPNSNNPGSYGLSGAFSGFSIAPASVKTADGKSVGSIPSILQTLSGSTIKISLDQSWLSKQAFSSFPVTIDPSVFGPSNIGNNFVDEESNNSTCIGSACPNEQAGNNGGTTNWRFAYQANLSPIPAGEFPLQANLGLVVNGGSSSSETLYADQSTCQNAFACYGGGWGESTGSIAGSGNLDVTTVYQGAMSVPGNTTPWVDIRGVETANSGTYQSFDPTQTTLTITYEDLPGASDWSTPSPANGGVSVSTEPTLFSTTSSYGSDPGPFGPGPIEYSYTLGTGQNPPAYNPFNTVPGVTGVIDSSAQTTQNQWTVPSGVLQDGNTYYWQVGVWDQLSGAPTVYSPVYSFKVDQRNGQDSTQSLDTMGPVNVDMNTGNLETSAQTNSISALGGDIGLNLDYNSPERSSAGLVGQYWNDPNGTHQFPSGVAPAFTQTAPNVNFNWGSGSPAPEIINDTNFLGMWTGYFVAPQTNTYQFGATSVDGVQIFVNGSETLNAWTIDPTNDYGSGVSLTAGQIVPITYEYDAWTGNSHSTEFLVKTTDGQIQPQVIPNTWLQTGIQPTGTQNGLLGNYYIDDGTHTFDTNTQSNEFLTRVDSSLSQNWGTGSPAPGGPTSGYIIRWTGYFTAPVADTYTFGAGSDDGVNIFINGSQVLSDWSDHGASPIAYASSGTTLSQGQTIPIEVDYYKDSSLNDPTGAQITLYAKQSSLGQNQPPLPVPSSDLSPTPQTLPAGWNVNLDAAGKINYDYAVINPNSVTLHGADGSSAQYMYVNGGFTPPPGYDGHMVRNSDGTVTLLDSDGRTYIFGPDGKLNSSSTPVDDIHPAALKYIYNTPSGMYSPELTQITDPVNNNRWLKILYSGNSSCPTPPSGYNSSAPANMICATTTSDGLTTGFFYINDASGIPVLGEIAKPGNSLTTYGYDQFGRINYVQDTLANDAIAAGAVTQGPTTRTQITYDNLGHVSQVMLPAATVGASQLIHTYNYYPGYSNMHITGATEPNGFTRKIEYDGTERTTDDINAEGLDTQTVWNATKDLKLATIDPASDRSTTIYDYADRPTDTYGPAPNADFDTNMNDSTYDTPLSQYGSQVAHDQSAYDGSIKSLAVAYYSATTSKAGNGTSTYALINTPQLEATGVGNANGDINQTWNSSPPITPISGDGWGAQLTGYINLASTGTYAFRLYSDDGVQMWIDDTLVISDWNNGPQRSHMMITGYPGFNNTVANSEHRIKIEYYNEPNASNAMLQLYMTPPGGTETSSLGSILNPGYGLKTSGTTYDSSASVGNSTTTYNYGANPELGLVQSSTVDPSGLNLTTSYTYEPEGGTGSFLRQLTKTLPGGAETQYTYYGAGDTATNPCNSQQSYYEGGQLKSVIGPNPGISGQNSVTTNYVYDNAGRIVATQTNSDPWTCYKFDSRGRTLSEAIPALPNTTHVTRSARTINYNYSVGSPLETEISDTSGSSVETVMDLLGRTTSYNETDEVSPNTYDTHGTNYTYDNLGRLSTKQSGGDIFNSAVTETNVYNNYNQISSYEQNGTVFATPSYDSYGRLSGVTYPQAGSLAESIGYDTNGRANNYTYTYKTRFGGNAQISDAVTYSQSGDTISGTENGASKAYTYDTDGRLTTATLGANAFSYNYGTPTACTGTYNVNAGKDSNRTSETVNGTTTTYCYDYADRLLKSSNTNQFGAVTYNSHSDIAAGSAFTGIEYDSSDRAVYIADTGGTNTSTFDPLDRTEYSSNCSCFYNYGSTGNTPQDAYNSGDGIMDEFFYLPGNVEMTNAPNQSTQTYSLADIHGDTLATTDNTGQLTGSGTFQYDPYGQILGGWSVAPNNDTGSGTAYGYLGHSGVITDNNTANDFMQMGARLYIPTLGRFAQPDPVDGGGDNNYTYPLNPVGSTDLTGDISVSGVYHFVCGDGLWQLMCFIPVGGWEFDVGRIGLEEGGRFAYEEGSRIITGYTKHALGRMAGTRETQQMSPQAVGYIVKYGQKTYNSARQTYDFTSFLGKVSLNKRGQVVTVISFTKLTRYMR